MKGTGAGAATSGRGTTAGGHGNWRRHNAGQRKRRWQHSRIRRLPRDRDQRWTLRQQRRAGGSPFQLTRPQTSYSITITSSGGGGLPDFGVFQDEKIYTVYLDMRANDTDCTPSWTLQYAVQQPGAGDPAEHIRGTPTPPYATLKRYRNLIRRLRRSACIS